MEEYNSDDSNSSVSVEEENSSHHIGPEDMTIGLTLNTSIEQAFRLNPSVEVLVLFKGRKYSWNAKINLHVHIIEHVYANIIEVVGYNTGTFLEAEHIYISSSYVYQKSEDLEVEEKVDMVLLEYQKLKSKIIPSVEVIKESLSRRRVSTYILDRLHVTTKPIFHIDIKESDKNYRLSSNQKQPHDRRPSTSDSPLPDAVLAHSISLAIRKPDIVIPTKIKRVGKSSTLIGDVVRVKLVKEDEQLQSIITALNSSSFASQAKRILNRVSLMQRNGTNNPNQANNIATLRRRGAIFQASNVQNTGNLKFFSKFKNDNDLLQESLSFLHISDMVEMLRVCKRWQQVLSYALRNLSSMVITSKDYYYHCNLDRDIIINRINYVESRHRRLKQIAASIMSRPNMTNEYYTGGRKDKRNNNQKEPGNNPLDHNSEGEEGRRRSFDSTEGQFIDHYHQHLAHSSRIGMTNNFYNHHNLLVVPERRDWPMLRVPQRFLLRKYFCRPDTVQQLIRNASRSITELRLHYVILNRDTIATLSSLTGRLKTLILGTIKIDDSHREPLASPMSPPTSSARPPNHSTPSNRYGVASHRKLIVGGSNDSISLTTSAPTTPHSIVALTPKLNRSKSKKVKTLRYMNARDLEEILFACGSEVTHLEVSLTVGELPPDIMTFVPKLSQFIVQDTLIAPSIATSQGNIEGNVQLDEIVNSLMGIPMPDLLTLMSDSVTEAFCLTDKRGKVVTVNAAWEKVFGHSRVDIVGSNIDFLGGPLTKRDDFEVILQGLKNQLRPEEITTFIYTKDEQPILTQIILLPNLSKWKGLPLNFDCLEPDLIGTMALEQEEAMRGKENGGSKKQKVNGSKGKKDWRISNHELSYHLLRFGLISNPFVPYQQAIYSDLKG